VLVEGKAIRLHPLVCAAFNADFDGDQMAVHVPLSFEAQLEAHVLMLSINNLLLPSSGKPVAVPSQDMVIGCYYLTRERRGVKGEGRYFSSPDQATYAHSLGEVDLHAIIKVSFEGIEGLVETTVGRIIFNEIIPKELGFFNDVANKSNLEKLVSQAYSHLGTAKTGIFLDNLKKIGFEYATLAGITVGIDDLVIPKERDVLVKKAFKEVEHVTNLHRHGAITNGERYNKVIDIWTRTTSDVTEAMFENLASLDQGFNPVYMMAISGARGSKDQVRQLAGMRGLMAKPQKKIVGQIGEIIETPITSNFVDGLTVQEYFISTHGARKGLADTALKTADAGYLTRRLVDVAQDVIITEEDCGTILGLNISALKEGEEIIESLADRILGRVVLEDVIHPITEEVLAKAGEMITDKIARQIEESGVEFVYIRSVLTCEARRGVCAKCYGSNLAHGGMVEIGEAVGVIAAQSIGEPGTQLTLRTFHIGGTAAVIAEQSKIEAKVDGKVLIQNVRSVPGKQEGEMIVLSSEGEIRIIDKKQRSRQRFNVPYGATLRVKDGQEVVKGTILFEWDPHTNVILTDKKGKVEFVDIIENVTFREELDESTGLSARVIIEQKDKSLRPQIMILSDKGKRIAKYSIPTSANLVVKDGEKVKAGDQLVKIPREIYKTKDITGGLPRVAELFEARHPKDPAVITEIDGVVEYGKIIRGNQQILVSGEHGEVKEYVVPHGKHMRVHNGDKVKAGDRLCEGPIDPHDILRIKGPNAVQEYLVNEIQGVYRLQGVKINDKHIEVIVRQMLQKVKVEEVGDTNFLEGEKVDKIRFNDENDRVLSEGGEPAMFGPMLMGITKASLSTESFISAASFQETTRVLTEAAINGKQDNLLGLKENVIIGHLIPAGTGLEKYRNVEIIDEEKTEEVEKETEKIG